MSKGKFILKLILGLSVYPFLIALVLSIVVGIFTQSSNQDKTNYSVSQQNITRLKGDKIVEKPLADPSFDAVAWTFMISFVLVATLFTYDTISSRKEKAKVE